MACPHTYVRAMTGCCATDLETGEQMYICGRCGAQGTMPELSENRPPGVHAIEVVDREELLRRYPRATEEA
jgi:hypothetical protein